jgi:hypothetical protein
MIRYQYLEQTALCCVRLIFEFLLMCKKMADPLLDALNQGGDIQRSALLNDKGAEYAGSVPNIQLSDCVLQLQQLADSLLKPGFIVKRKLPKLDGRERWVVDLESKQSGVQAFMPTCRFRKLFTYKLACYARVRVHMSVVLARVLNLGADSIECPDGTLIDAAELIVTADHPWSTPIDLLNKKFEKICELDPIRAHWLVRCTSKGGQTYICDTSAIDNALVREAAMDTNAQITNPYELAATNRLYQLPQDTAFFAAYDESVCTWMRRRVRNQRKRNRKKRKKSKPHAEGSNE